ncbi:hypothetical protein D3C75_728460 [compost metagenome]
MDEVALPIHLGLFPVGGRRQRHHAKHPRADPLGDRLDRAALACTIAALEDDAHLQALGHHPFLQLDQLDVQPPQLGFIVLAAQSFLLNRCFRCLFLLSLGHWLLPRDSP